MKLILIFPGENRRPARRGAPPWQPYMPGHLPGEDGDDGDDDGDDDDDDDDDDDGAPPWQPHMPGYLPGEEDRQRLNVAKNEIDDLKCNFKSKGVKTRSNLS